MGKTIKMNSFQDVCKDVEQRFVKAGIKTVNIVAASARNNAISNIEKDFTLRNDFTTKGVVFTPCSSSVRTLKDIMSETGIDERRGYMARQETGGVKKNPSGNNLIIPNTNARGTSNKNKVKSKFFYRNIRHNFKPRQNSSKLALAVAAKNASMVTGGGFIRINQTIFHVTKFMKKGDNRMFISKPVLNLTRMSVQIKEKPWLVPASDYAAQMMQDVFNKQMDALK